MKPANVADNRHDAVGQALGENEMTPGAGLPWRVRLIGSLGLTPITNAERQDRYRAFEANPKVGQRLS